MCTWWHVHSPRMFRIYSGYCNRPTNLRSGIKVGLQWVSGEVVSFHSLFPLTLCLCWDNLYLHLLCCVSSNVLPIATTVVSVFSERWGSRGLCDHCAHSAGHLPDSFCSGLHWVDLQEASTYFLPGHMGLFGCHGIPFYVFWRDHLSLGSSKTQIFSIMTLWGCRYGICSELYLH